ncbi:MAG: 1-acyl-sn-glycerol-3-phosphate acyltransferase [Bacteroidaceae bacterium]|nr:1-acyl-sn-glycerol-3-phosphate acyltransferase [Bacteroidaceae bacterium]
MLSTQIPEEFKDIRPYAPDEFPQVFNELMADRQFVQIVQKVAPEMAAKLPAFLANMAQPGGRTMSAVDVQKLFFYPLLKKIAEKCSLGLSLVLPEGFDRARNYTFVTNHRDIVLDSAFLSCLLVDNGFDNTVEIAIGDNLLIYPWIKKLVRINKSFIVQRSLPPRQAFAASVVMSRYMHFAINQKHENIWIAQREGRAKDSNDCTQEAILKMMTLGGEGGMIERLKDMHIVPMALSYELDPCDYLKAKEFQQKRDIEGFKKSREDDLTNMQTGIFGAKGHICFEAAPCIDEWLDTLPGEMPRGELFSAVAKHIDREIHRSYTLYPFNYIAADRIEGTNTRAGKYNSADTEAFDKYLAQRLSLIDLPAPDTQFLTERILTMYANPVFNNEKVKK